MNSSYNGQTNIIIQQHSYIDDSFCSGTEDEIPSISSNSSMQIASNGSGKNISSTINNIIQPESHINRNSILHQSHNNQNIYGISNSFHSPYHHFSEYQNNNSTPSTSSNVELQYTYVDSNPTSNDNIMTLNTITNPRILHNSSSQQIILTSPVEESSSIIQKYETSRKIISVNRNNTINGSLTITSDIDGSNHHQVSNSNYVTATSRPHVSSAPTYYLDTIKNSSIASTSINGNQIVYRSPTTVCNINQNSKQCGILGIRKNVSLKNLNSIPIHNGGQQPRIIHNICSGENTFNITDTRSSNNNYEETQQSISHESESILRSNIHKTILSNDNKVGRMQYVSFSSPESDILINNSSNNSQKTSNNNNTAKEIINYVGDKQNVEKLVTREENSNIISKNLCRNGKYIQNSCTFNDDHKKEDLTKQQKLEAKRAKQAEVARKRYHNLSEEEKKELNKKRTLAQKMKRQRDKEMMELDNILRQSNDIVEDPEINKVLKSKKMRARWAEAARARYHRMTPEEKKAYNLKRRMKQLASNVLDNDKISPEEKQKILQKNLKEQNARKAEAARLRYHAMTDEQKRAYNRKRTEALRKKRDEEEKLLSIPVKNITKDTWEKAQKILTRNERRAAAARLRYQKMTPEERRLYNRRKPKHKDSKDNEHYHLENFIDDQSSYGEHSDKTLSMSSSVDYNLEENDILSNIERDVIRRTHIAKQTLIRQNNDNIKNAIEKEKNNPSVHIISDSSNFVTHIHHPCESQLILNDLTTNSMTNGNIVYSQDDLVQILPESPSIESNVVENYQSSPISSQTYNHDANMNHSTISGATYYTTSVVDSDSGSPTENGTLHFQNMTPVTYTSNNGTSYYTTTQASVYGSPVMSNGEKNDYVVISNNSLHGDNGHHINSHSVIHCHDIKEEVDSMGIGRSQHLEMGGNGNGYLVQQPTTSHGMIHQSGSQNDLYDYFVEQGNSNHELIMQGNHMSGDNHLDLGLSNEDSLGSNSGLYHDDLNSNTHHSDNARNSYDIDDDIKNEDDILDEQRAKEVEELEDILRKSNDIQRDVTISDIKKGKNQKSPNSNRKKRLSLSTVEERAKEKGLDPEALRIQIVQQNAKKAEAARMRYHRMNPEEKRIYNQRRTEAFRRRRMEEEMLLSTPAGRISQDALKKAQQIMMRNAKRAELARLRYHKMTPEERKAYNQRRSNAKRKRSSSLATSQGGASVNSQDFSINSDAGNNSEDNNFIRSNEQNANNSQIVKAEIKTEIDEHLNLAETNISSKIHTGKVKQCSFDFPDGVCIFEDTLRSLEEDVLRRTQLAKDALIRKKAQDPSNIGENNTNKQQDLNMSIEEEDDDDEIQHQLINQPGSHNTVMMHQQPVQMGRMNQIPVQQNIPLQTAQIVTVDGQNGQQYANLPPGAQVIILGHNQQFLTTDDLGHGTTVLQDGTKIIPVAPSNQTQTVYIQHLENGQIIQTIEPPPMQVIQMTDVNGQIIQQPLTVMPIRGHQQPLAFEQQGNIIIHQSPMIEKNHHDIQGDGRVRNHMYQEIQTSHPNTIHLNNRHQMQIIEMKNDCEEDTISPIIDQVCVDAANNDVRSAIPDEKSEKLAAQRARRAARARQRYHQMSDEDRKKFNAKRAIALRKARQRDEELCQLYDAAQQTGAVIDEKTMQEILEAQRRRSRRAEAARLKYQRMTVEERKEYNAMRDAQRRQRKRRLEEQQMKNGDGNSSIEMLDSQHHDDDHDLSDLHDDSIIGDESHVNNSNEMPIVYTQYEVYDNQMQSNWDA